MLAERIGIVAVMENNDFIWVKELRIFAHHGVLSEEKENGQDFFLNAKLYYDMHKPGQSDALDDALNYADCCQFMTDVFTRKNYDLIEAACENLCIQLLLHYEVLKKVELELCKPHAPIGLPFGNVSVNMTRGWHTVYLSFGSNMGDRQALIAAGLEEIRKHPFVRNPVTSSLITTRPYGPVEQEDFLNGCLRMETLLEPEDLLSFLHEVEAHAKRKREIVWGPRTLDLDIVFFDKEVYESADLIIPHVDMQNRQFVLEPLKELCPNYRHPVLGLTVSQMYRMLTEQQQEREKVK